MRGTRDPRGVGDLVAVSGSSIYAPKPEHTVGRLAWAQWPPGGCQWPGRRRRHHHPRAAHRSTRSGSSRADRSWPHSAFRSFRVMRVTFAGRSETCFRLATVPRDAQHRGPPQGTDNRSDKNRIGWPL